MRLPSKVGGWENSAACGAAGAPASDIDRWKTDSVAIGGVYAYPKTDVQFFDCTNNATAVTAQAQILATLIATTEGSSTLVGYHCYGAADNCNGEGLGPKGTAELTASMTAGCVPRH